MFKKLSLDKKSPIKASCIAYRLSPKNGPTHPLTWRRKVWQRWGLRNIINEILQQKIDKKKTPPILSI
jgi:hypothetical protein